MDQIKKAPGQRAAERRGGRGTGTPTNAPRMSARTIARFGMLTAIALVLGWLETFVPIGMPGIKLGLSNTVLLYAIYLMGAKQAVTLMLLKVFLSGFLFGSFSTIFYSLSGGVLSLIVMLLLRRVRRVDLVPVSVAGAIAHNTGQMLAAICIVPARAILPYAPVLLISAVVMGVLTGVAAKYTFRALKVAFPVAAKPKAPDGKKPE